MSTPFILPWSGSVVMGRCIPVLEVSVLSPFTSTFPPGISSYSWVEDWHHSIISSQKYGKAVNFPLFWSHLSLNSMPHHSFVCIADWSEKISRAHHWYPPHSCLACLPYICMFLLSVQICVKSLVDIGKSFPWGNLRQKCWSLQFIFHASFDRQILNLAWPLPWQPCWHAVIRQILLNSFCCMRISERRHLVGLEIILTKFLFDLVNFLSVNAKLWYNKKD